MAKKKYREPPGRTLKRHPWDTAMDVLDFADAFMSYRRPTYGRRRRRRYPRRRWRWRFPWNRRKWRRKLRPFRYYGPPIITGIAAELIPQIPLDFFTAVGGATTVGILAALLWRF